MDDVLKSILSKYPRLVGHPWNVIDSRGKGKEGGPGLEFYPPDERDNPAPGKATIEVFDQKLQGEELNQSVFGDMLHHLPSVDPRFNVLREQYRRTLTPEQSAMDKTAYERDKAKYGESRPYEDWMNQSRLDAHLRGYLAPDRNDEWRKAGRGAYTPAQIGIFETMRQHLSSPVEPE